MFTKVFSCDNTSIRSNINELCSKHNYGLGPLIGYTCVLIPQFLEALNGTSISKRQNITIQKHYRSKVHKKNRKSLGHL